jgi:hypothetical protein
MQRTAKSLGGGASKLLMLLLCLLLCSCRRAYDDPLRNRLTGIQTNLLGKWETLLVSPAPRFGNNALDAVFSHRDTWDPGNTGKGFEFCRDGTLKIYSFTNATPRAGPPASTFSLTATGHYSLTNGVLQVRLNGEVASTAFPPAPRTDLFYLRLPKREQAEIAGAIYLTLTNEAGPAGSIGMLKVSKFKFE